jgi:hypothetical protein
MRFEIAQQESFSRGELLLRTFFGWLYIVVPHALVLFFIGIWSAILHFVAWWVILFTGRYPASFFEFHTKMIAWNMRLNACTWNLIDGYPAIGTAGSHPAVALDVPYPQSLSRAKLLLRAFFGLIYVSIPHGFCLYLRLIATGFLNFLSWWTILFWTDSRKLVPVQRGNLALDGAAESVHGQHDGRLPAVLRQADHGRSRDRRSLGPHSPW